MQHETIVIVGGGPVGLVTALTLARDGIEVTLLDSKLDSIYSDGRVLALSYASYMHIKSLGVNLNEYVTAIDKVHISHTGFGVSNIEASDVDLVHLGYTIKYVDLVRCLYQKIREYSLVKLHQVIVNDVVDTNNYVTISYNKLGSGCDIVTADLVILAEGGRFKQKNINYRMHDYQKQAVIAKIKTKIPHNNIAHERFELDGPMVLLPSEDNYILVWALPNSMAENLCRKDELLTKLNELSFMKRFGSFSILEEVAIFPLKLQVAQNRVLNRMVLIGNSSQTVHPISAQGLNLGLRDVRDLCEIIIQNNNLGIKLDDISCYNHKRSKDVVFVSNFTHILARFLEIQSPFMQLTRGVGLVALSNCKYLQNKLSRSLIFGI
jgi:2-octaprenyl-6-methoxyphenol hydroxylase